MKTKQNKENYNWKLMLKWFEDSGNLTKAIKVYESKGFTSAIKFIKQVLAKKFYENEYDITRQEVFHIVFTYLVSKHVCALLD